MSKQTEAQRLADSISRMDTFTEHQRSEIQKAAAELRLQEELLRQALEQMESNHYAVAEHAPHKDVMAFYEVTLKIRNHLEGEMKLTPEHIAELRAEYLRGLEDAAKVADDDDHIVEGKGYHDQLGDAKLTAANIREAIRALKGKQ